MMDFDTIITNLYINLAKGDLKTPIKDLRFTEQFIEEKVRSGNNSILPIDVLLFSKHFNLAWAIELKDITSTDLNESQAHAYNNLTHSSFATTLASHRERNSMIVQAAYHGNTDNAKHISNSLETIDVKLPVVVLDVDNCKLYHFPDSEAFTNSHLNRAFSSIIDLKIKSMDQLVNYVRFSPKTNHTIVNSICLPRLVQLTIDASRKNRNSENKYEFTIANLAKESYSTIDLWDKLDSSYRHLLIRAVRDALSQLEKAGLEALKVTGGNKASIDIFDVNGNVNQQTLQSITQRIEATSPEVFMSQSSLI